MENQDFSEDIDFEDDVISELSDASEHSEVSTNDLDDLISQEHWDISSDEFETDFGTVD